MAVRIALHKLLFFEGSKPPPQFAIVIFRKPRHELRRRFPWQPNPGIGVRCSKVARKCGRRGPRRFHQKRQRHAVASARAAAGRPAHICDDNRSESLAKRRNFQTGVRMGLPQPECRSRTDHAGVKSAQIIEGFGGCFNERGWTSLNALSEPDRESILRELGFFTS